MSKTLKAFETLLETFVKATATSMEAARELAEMSIIHFETCSVSGDGDPLLYAQRFLDAMDKNYNRCGAFVKWLMDHAPVKAGGNVKDGYNLSKDKSPDANKLRVQVALLTPFWEYNPPTEKIIFSTADVIKAMKAAVKKFSGDNYRAYGDLARMAVQKAATAVDHLEQEIRVEVERSGGASIETVPTAQAIEVEPVLPPTSDIIPVGATKAVA